MEFREGNTFGGVQAVNRKQSATRDNRSTKAVHLRRARSEVNSAHYWEYMPVQPTNAGFYTRARDGITRYADGSLREQRWPVVQLTRFTGVTSLFM